MKLLLPLSLYNSHIKSSRKVLAFSCIGLIVALTLVSSSLYFLDNSRHEILDNYLQGKSTGNDIQFNIKQNFKFNSTPSIETIKSSIQNITSTYHFDFINSSATEIIHGIGNVEVLGSEFMLNNQTSFVQANMFQMTPKIKFELQKIHLDQYGKEINFSSENAGENSLIQAFVLFNGFNWFPTIQSPIPDHKIGPSSLYIESYCFIYRCDFPFPVNVTNYEVLKPTFYSPFQDVNRVGPQEDSQIQLRYPNIYALSLMSVSPSFMVFVNNMTLASSIIQHGIDIHLFHPDLGDISFQNYFIAKLVFDYSKLNFENVNNFLDKQNLFGGTVISELSLKDFPYISVLYHSSGFISYVDNQIQILTSQILFIDLPSLIIALFLAHYVFGLIYKNIVRNISIYKTRGVSSWVIFFFQMFDVVVVLLASITTALILGVPLSVFSLKSDNLLSFNHALPEFFIFNFSTVAVTLIYFAIVIEFIVNVNRIRKLSRISITDTDNPQEISRNNKAYWMGNFADIELLVYSIGTYVIYFYITSNTGLRQSLNPVLPIINTLMIPSPLIFVIGCILLLSRTIPILLDKMSLVLWKLTGNLTALSFKNIVRYKNTTLRAVLIIACVIAFMTFFYSQPYSIMQNYKQQAYYQAGADGVAVFRYSSYNQNVIDELTTNPEYSKYIDSVSSFAYLIGGSTSEQLNFLLVNTSNYLQTSYLNYDLGLRNSLQSDMQAITLTNFTNYNYLTSVNVLVDINTLNQRQAGVGSHLGVVDRSIQRFTVIDSFSYWPYLTPLAGEVSSSLPNFVAIGDINYFLQDMHSDVYRTIFSSVAETGAFIKFKDVSSAELSNITSTIEKNLPLVFKSVPKLEFENNIQNFSFLAIGEVNLNVLISFAIIIIVILLYIQLQLVERRREMYTERAMGMKPTQLAYMFYVENIVILIFSIIIGTVIGIYFVQLITIVSASSNAINHFDVVYIPFDTLFVTDAIILVLSLIFSLIPSNSLLKQNISNAFIGED